MVSDTVFTRLQLSLSKEEIERNVNDNIVDFVVVRARVQNFKIALCQKFETGLEIKRSDTSSDCASHACTYKIRLLNFINLDPAEREVHVSHDRSSRLFTNAKVFCQRPFRCQIEVLNQGKDVKTSDDNSTILKFNNNISEVPF